MCVLTSESQKFDQFLTKMMTTSCRNKENARRRFHFLIALLSSSFDGVFRLKENRVLESSIVIVTLRPVRDGNTVAWFSRVNGRFVLNDSPSTLVNPSVMIILDQVESAINTKQDQ